jgi:hypothetical protein
VRRRAVAALAPLALAAAALLPRTALADPGYYLVTPYSQPGMVELDLRYWSVNPRGEGDSTLWPELGLRYGVNSRWTTELLASFIGPTLGHQRISSWNWHNTVLLTQGQYPFDLGLHANIVRQSGWGNAVELGPVFQTDIGFTQLNANLFVEREFAEKENNLKYQWQLLRRLRPGLRLGVQGFGEREMAGGADWSHRAGPVLRWNVAEHLQVQAAYLWGKVYGSRGDMFSAQVLVPF